MKRTLLLTLLVGFIGLGSIAQESTLIVFSEEGAPFDLFLNGVAQNTKPETNIRVTGLTQPHYYAKVVFHDKSLGWIEKKNLMVVDADGIHAEVTYTVKRTKKGKLAIRYYSSVPVGSTPAPTPTETVVVYTSTPRPVSTTNTSVTVSETTTTTTTSGQPAKESIDVNMNVGGIDVGMDVNVSVNDGGIQTTTTTSPTETVDMDVNMSGIGMNVDMNVTGTDTEHTETVTTTTTTTTTTTEEHNRNEFGSTTGTTGGCYPMAGNDFNAAKKSISEKSFSDSKMTLAKQIAQNNCLSAQQIKEITTLFDFEDNRIEFAKVAYDKCSDKGNYFKVNEAFEFEASIEELQEYISKR